MFYYNHGTVIKRRNKNDMQDIQTNVSNNNENLRLDDIEKELSNVLNATIKSWIRVANLLDQVQKFDLWKQDAKNHSFSQWVKRYAKANNIHESYLWKIKKSGDVYRKYEDYKISQGADVTAFNDLNVDRQSFEIAAKVAGSNDAVLYDLCEKIENKELTRKDLKQAYAQVRADRDAKGIKQPANGYESKIEVTKEDLKKSKEKMLIADDIVNALRCNLNWIKELEPNDGRAIKTYEQSKYATFTEFPVQTGTARHARRIDVLVASNRGLEPRIRRYGTVLHAIEIKVDLYDLKNDKKANEYAEFVDALWFAIPNNPEMIDLIVNEQLETTGILLIDDDGTVNVYREAKVETGIRRVETLMTLVNKMI